MREAKGIRNEFRTRPELKISLTWMTPTGQLTKKANDFIFDTVHEELEMQRTYDTRCNVVGFQCMTEGMTPFSPDVLGEAMFTKSEDVFLFKLKTLIDLEKDRLAKQQYKIEQDRQLAVEVALKKQQAEAERERQAAINEALRQDRLEAVKRQQDELTKKPVVTPQPDGTRLVRYVKTYQARVKSTTTNEQFKTMIDKEVTESGRAQKALVSAEVFDV
jgi:hypothetical protein